MRRKDHFQFIGERRRTYVRRWARKDSLDWHWWIFIQRLNWTLIFWPENLYKCITEELNSFNCLLQKLTKSLNIKNNMSNKYEENFTSWGIVLYSTSNRPNRRAKQIGNRKRANFYRIYQTKNVLRFELEIRTSK